MGQGRRRPAIQEECFMFKGVDHVVIAVKDLDTAVSNYESIYGTSVSERREAPAAGMKMAFFRFGDSYIELVSNSGDEGPIAKRLASLGEGVHLVAMRVDDLQSTLADLRQKGVRLVGDPGPDKPVTGQVFIHPSATGGVLTQLVQG
jgi:lactoylglutathione lyase/methylmalonyl-CoA/ethylmalonyl-CoA epimerase